MVDLRASRPASESRCACRLAAVPGWSNALLTGAVDAGWSGISDVLALMNTGGGWRALCVSVSQRRPVAAGCADPATSSATRASDVATMLGSHDRPAGVPAPIVARAAVGRGEDPARAGDGAAHGHAGRFTWKKTERRPARSSSADDLARYTAVVDAVHLEMKIAPRCFRG